MKVKVMVTLVCPCFIPRCAAVSQTRSCLNVMRNTLEKSGDQTVSQFALLQALALKNMRKQLFAMLHTLAQTGQGWESHVSPRHKV